jgi:hypothetical protein
MIAVLLSGCGKPAGTSSTRTAPEAARGQSASNLSETGAPLTANPVANPVANTETAEDKLAASLAELTQALRKYSAEKQRVPKTFDELVANGYVKQVPPAPAGKKFAVDGKRLQVVLVNQ